MPASTIASSTACVARARSTTCAIDTLNALSDALVSAICAPNCSLAAENTTKSNEHITENKFMSLLDHLFTPNQKQAAVTK